MANLPFDYIRDEVFRIFARKNPQISTEDREPYNEFLGALAELFYKFFYDPDTKAIPTLSIQIQNDPDATEPTAEAQETEDENENPDGNIKFNITIAPCEPTGGYVQMRVDSGHIQYRAGVAGEWTNVIALVDITGPAGADGADGADGREVEFQVGGGYIQWRYAGEVGWTNLVALVDITGPAGADGTDGTDGTDGADGTDFVVTGYDAYDMGGVLIVGGLPTGSCEGDDTYVLTWGCKGGVYGPYWQQITVA